MRPTKADEDRVVSLLLADIDATIGRTRVGEEIIAETAADRRTWVHDRVRYIEDTVNEVQQYLHDTFLDTTWPACPHHPSHPLWFSEGAWRCERDKQPVAALGELSKVKR